MTDPFHPFGRSSRTFLLLALLVLPASLAAQRQYRIGSPSSWVQPIHPDPLEPAPASKVTEGYEMLLEDRQQSVTAAGFEQYVHLSYRLLDDRAVENHSQIELVFDPTYEQLTLHAVTVTRDGNAIDQLKPDRIRVAERESNIDRHMFDGTLSVVVVLEGVKRGDVVEYSYSRRGSNPVFAGHYMSGFGTQEDVPIRRLSFRLLWPRDRKLFIRRHEASIEPSLTTAGDHQEYRWSTERVPAKVVDQNLPDWYYPYPWIQLSDFPSWSAVAAWGDSLFSTPGPIPPQLAAKISGIRAGGGTREEQVLAALRYAQDEVRYLGVEIGANSHRPYPVATVLNRGYGDCKDKAQLLVAMLRELGVEASPALVSTDFRDHVGEMAPSARYFDHAIVRVRFDGREVWLDPTVLYQRGGLETVAAQFGAGLVLAPGTDSLSAIARSAAAEPLTDIKVDFELGELGQPATMHVASEYHGSAAVAFRESFRTSSPEELQRRYTEFYADGYPGITMDGPPEISDDEVHNTIRTSEQYTIPGFWHKSVDDESYLGTFNPVELDRTVPSTSAAGRTMPLAVEYPSHLRYTIAAHLKEGWQIAPKGDTLETAAARFVRTIAVEDSTLELNYEYQALADHVSATAAADHIDKISRMNRMIRYSVTPPDTGSRHTWSNPAEINWTVLLIGFFTAGLSLLGAVRLIRSPAPAWPPTAATPDPRWSGIVGWLVLLAIVVVIFPISVVWTMGRDFSAYTLTLWARHTTPGASGYHPLYEPVLLLELVTNTALIVLGTTVAWLFFKRRRWFPAFFVGLCAIRVIADWVDVLLSHRLPTLAAVGIDWSQHARATVTLALWVLYILRSKRVQNTFVN